MVIDIKMCRFDNVPWGFRLVGGSDFEIPLTVVKVTEGSLAEDAGLRVDDVIVRINDDAASPMTHDEAHKVISHCGNVFYLGIQRESEDNEQEKMFPIIKKVDPEFCHSPNSLTDSVIQSQIDELSNENHELAMPKIDQVIPNAEPENKAEDEEIASLLSAEAEVLKDHNVLGIFPKPGVCQSSEVLRQLNEEAIKTTQEKIEEKKKWTTFLQRPDRPIPKSKQQLEAEARAANAYKVKIMKNYKKPEPVRPPSPVPEPEPESVEEPPEAVVAEPEVEEEPPTDSEVPNLEQVGDAPNPKVDSTTEEAIAVEKEQPKETEDQTTREASVVRDEREASVTDEKAPSESGSLREKTEEELQLEQQLADVQKQLLALSTLPSTIQSTLDAVTKQLSELLPMFKLQPGAVKESTPTPVATEEKQEHDQEKAEVLETTSYETEETTIVAEREVRVVEEVEESLESTQTEIIQTDFQQVLNVETDVKQVVEQKLHEMELRVRNVEEEQMEEEQNLKRKKENGVIEELQKQIEQKEVQKRKRSKRLFGPLVPQERPLVLPGGRRWYRPKDAYNDEFIAETLTAQAELIAGTTMGCKFESPLLGYDERENNCRSVVRQLEKRVNFMKYQKPEKKIDLDKSEVYKVIHHLDKSPVRGIEVRPPVVIAEADVRRAVEL